MNSYNSENELKKEIFKQILGKITKEKLLEVCEILEISINQEVRKEELVPVLIDVVFQREEYVFELIRIVNQIEEWGKQHIYLYKGSPGVKNRFKSLNERDFKALISEAPLKELVNSESTLFLPDNVGYKVSEITLEESKRIKIKWVERRKYRVRLEDRDFVAEDDSSLEYDAYNVSYGRGVAIFDWDLNSNKMVIKISQSAKTTDYKEARKIVLKFLDEIFDIEREFTHLDIRKSIQRIKMSGEVKTKKYNQETLQGGKLSVSARDKKTSVESDRDLANASAQIRGANSSTYGNYYWLSSLSDNLDVDVHTTIDSNSESVLFYGYQTEMAVKHVLSRIYYFIRNA